MKFFKFKKQKNYKKVKEGVLLHTHRYWEAAVFCMCGVTLLSILFGYYLFMGINQDSTSTTGNVPPQNETIKKERIDKVLEYFSMREQKSNQILNSAAPVADPSV